MGTQHGTHTAFLLFKDFFMCHSTFQLWACLPYRRNFRDAFKSKSSKESRLHLLRRLSLELYGDVAQTLDLCSTFDAIAPKQSPARRKSEALATALASPIDTMKSLPMSFYNENIKQFSEYTNQIIAERVQECYGSFISWTTSILSDDTLNQLMQTAFDMCEFQLCTIMEMLGYHEKITEFRNQHRIKSYQRMAMFMFFSPLRVFVTIIFLQCGLLLEQRFLMDLLPVRLLVMLLFFLDMLVTYLL
jgi:hypothetical protein